MSIKVGRVLNCTHYCARPSSYRGIGLDYSILGNPFPLKNDTPRERSKVLEKYKGYFFTSLDTNSEFKAAVDSIIKSARNEIVILGCFCYPKECHCDVIKNYVESFLDF